MFTQLLVYIFIFNCDVGKLQSRSYKIAYALLNKVSSKPDICVKSGDRVALVFPNSDPIGFICAFYGCLHAGVVPVPIEVPLTRRVILLITILLLILPLFFSLYLGSNNPFGCLHYFKRNDLNIESTSRFSF